MAKNRRTESKGVSRVSRFCSPEVEYIVINCRPHYLPREFSAILFVAVYLPLQADAGNKTALSQLYKEISKQETTHPEAALLVAGDFNAGKLKSVLPNFHQHLKCATRDVYKETCTKLSLTLHLANLTINLSS